MTVFDDPNVLFRPDPNHSQQEERFTALGFSEKAQILAVCHCYYESDTVIRIISARRASKSEENIYGGAL
jgi:hypothetical protein